MEDYKKKYEEALERARKINNGDGVAAPFGYTVCESIFPELKESEDEKIRKELIALINALQASKYTELNHYNEFITWLEKQDPKKHEEELEKAYKCSDEVQYRKGYEAAKKELEKQGEQKYTDKIEPKFKVGDYIINEYGFVMQIDGIIDNMYSYHVVDNTGERMIYGTYDITKTKKSCHLWTIQDAKDGDVIVSNQIIILFKKFQEKSDCNFVIAYAGIDISGKLQITNKHWLINNDSTPATKEQRDLLFQKMKEAGYEWNSEKKELKKIEQETTWSIKDEAMFNSALWHINNSTNNGLTGDGSSVREWLKSIKERIKGE